jgi:hypothetical protein
MTGPTVQQAITAATTAAGQTQAQVENQIGHSAAMDRMREVQSANQQREIDALRDQLSRRAPPPPPARASPEMLYQIAKDKETFKRELAAKEALLLEWRHSDASFRKLAKTYGKRLGISDEERAADFQQAIVDIAAEHPQFVSTNILDIAKKRLIGAKASDEGGDVESDAAR